jgi:AcrR family transcriptional regulator
VTTASVLERTRRAEQAKAVRREEILASARRVFAVCGFRGTTIADIAEEAHIALGTIYLYFASKEDVFAALNEQFNALIAAAMTESTAAASLDETIRRRVENVFEACAGNRDLVRLVVLNTDPDSAVTRRLRDAATERSAPMVEAIREAMATGNVRAGDPCIMSRLITGLVSFAVYQAFVLSEGQDADKYRTACGDMIVSYLTPQK